MFGVGSIIRLVDRIAFPSRQRILHHASGPARRLHREVVPPMPGVHVYNSTDGDAGRDITEVFSAPACSLTRTAQCRPFDVFGTSEISSQA